LQDERIFWIIARVLKFCEFWNPENPASEKRAKESPEAMKEKNARVIHPATLPLAAFFALIAIAMIVGPHLLILSLTERTEIFGLIFLGLFHKYTFPIVLVSEFLSLSMTIYIYFTDRVIFWSFLSMFTSFMNILVLAYCGLFLKYF